MGSESRAFRIGTSYTDAAGDRTRGEDARLSVLMHENFPRMTATPELKRRDARRQSGVAPRPAAEEQVTSGTNIAKGGSSARLSGMVSSGAARLRAGGPVSEGEPRA